MRWQKKRVICSEMGAERNFFALQTLKRTVNYTYGVIDEIYQMCVYLSRNIDITHYTDCLDTIGIVPMIAPDSILNDGSWKETKNISLTYRMASISLVSDYDVFVSGDIEVKKRMIVENVLRSLQVIKTRLKGKFQYELMAQDIVAVLKSFEIEL